jgi:hypothetical protein
VILDNTKVVEGLEMFVVVKGHDFRPREFRVMNFESSRSGFDLGLDSSGCLCFLTMITAESYLTNN